MCDAHMSSSVNSRRRKLSLRSSQGSHNDPSMCGFTGRRLWVHSYVSDDKFTAVQRPSAAMVLEHAKCGGFSANRISQFVQ